MKLTDKPEIWPGGSGAWSNQPRIVIISNDARALADRKPRAGASVVATPLDLINELDRGSEVETIVVLDGGYAGCRELALVLLDLYPWVRVVDGDPDTFPTRPLPTSCGISLTAL